MQDGVAASVGGELILGKSKSGDGTLNIAGPTTVLTTGGAGVTIGDAGTGTLTVTGGGPLDASADDVTAGDQDGATGVISETDSEIDANSLTIGGGASAAGGTGILVLGTGTTADVTSAIVWSSGTVDLTGGALRTDPIEINGGTISGFGTISGAVTDGGNIIASGGTLDVTGHVSGSGSLKIAASSSLLLEGTVDTTDSAIFSGTKAAMVRGASADVLAKLNGLGTGDSIGIEDAKVTSATYDSITQALSITGNSGSSFDLGLVGSYQQSDFAVSGGEVVVVCFLRGTSIATPTGERAVESLSAGEAVLTLRGVIRRIAWIGTGRVLAPRGRRNSATPVIVRKGALAENVPDRDLRVTKGHSFYIDGALIPIEFLINGRSIVWDDHAQEVAFYHVELDTHDVLIVNGAPAESYRDDGNRWLFRNANSGWGLPLQEPFAPVLTGGALVDAVWRRLLERAVPRGNLLLTDNPDLHLVVDGRRVDAMKQQADAHVFRLPARPRRVSICSRTAVPQELGLTRDGRLLGMAVRRIVLVEVRRQRAIAADDAMLTDGYHAFEAENRIRWTNGNAAVPIGLFAGMNGPGMLVLHLGAATRYTNDGGARQVA